MDILAAATQHRVSRPQRRERQLTSKKTALVEPTQPSFWSSTIAQSKRNKCKAVEGRS